MCEMPKNELGATIKKQCKNGWVLNLMEINFQNSILDYN